MRPRQIDLRSGTTLGGTANRVAIFDSTNTLTTDAELAYNASTNILSGMAAVRVGAGSVTAPSISLGDTGFGLFKAAVDARLQFVEAASTEYMQFQTDTNRLLLASDWSLCWVDAANIQSATTTDLFVSRDAANVLALKNGTTAQEFRVYGTTTGSKYVNLRHDSANAYIDTTAGALNLVPNSGLVTINTALSIGTNPADADTFRLPNGFDISGRNAANNGNVRCMSLNASNQVVLASGGNATVIGGTLTVSGASVAIGTNPASTGAVRLANNSNISARDASNASDRALIGLSSTNIITVDPVGGENIRIGGTSGSLIGLFGATPAARTSLAAASGTATRTTFDTSTVTTAQLAERVKAMIDDWRATGYWA